MTPRRLSLDDLHRIIPTFSAEMRNDAGGRTIGLANKVIAHFLGQDWFEAHIRHDADKQGYLTLDFSTDRRREATVFRVVELAENLFNLQNIDGFDACIAQMQGGGDLLESTCAELDVGRFLYIHDVNFRFVVPQKARGSDYDFEVMYDDGRIAPADAKCKLESTAIDPTTIRNSLEKARKQLPRDQAGIIFMKVPQTWIETIAMATEIVDVARGFMRNTGRIISIKFYVSHLQLSNEAVLHRHAYRELTNESSRFYAGQKWDIFKDYPVPSSWNGMPSKWQRLFFFPYNPEE